MLLHTEVAVNSSHVIIICDTFKFVCVSVRVERWIRLCYVNLRL
jgi:hypothetical protein